MSGSGVCLGKCLSCELSQDEGSLDTSLALTCFSGHSLLVIVGSGTVG